MTETGSPHAVGYLTRGKEALARADWAEARSEFEAAVAEDETPEALEGLGVAAWWLEDTRATIDARRRAYRLYRSRGDAAGAARAATGLAMDFYFEGEEAVARGWMQRARRLLDGSEDCVEFGWVAIAEAEMALFVDHDPAAAEELTARAIALGRSLGDVDLEMVALAYQGFALVSRGRIDEGMRSLDEATTAAMAGEMSDIDATARTCCCLIYACERVRDYGRASQWCERLKEFCERWSYQLMFWICRAHHAGVLIWRGAWGEAEAELEASIAAFAATRPAEAAEALVRLAELRWRQGRFDEADELLARAESGPTRMLGRPLVPLVRAELALSRADPDGAVDWAERFLASIPAENWMERTAAWDVLVRARLASGSHEEAREAASELTALAERIGTDPMLAGSRFAEGLVAAAEDDHAAARNHLGAAVSLYERSGAPFEAARARVELARSLAALGRDEAGRREADAAVEAFAALGARVEAERAAAALEPEVPIGRQRGPAGLTQREIDVIRLVAEGLSNEDIAQRLYLSVRTVERHLSNVYVKIGARGKAARAAVSAFAAKHDLI